MLGSGEYIFIPYDNLVSIVREDGTASGDNSPVILYKHCLVDASNIVVVKNALGIESYTNPIAHTLLNVLSSASFDTTINRSPTPHTLSQYLAGHYAGVTNAAGDSTGEEGASTDTPTPATPAKKTGRNRSKRASGSSTGDKTGTSTSTSASTVKGSLREWQELKKWNMMITSMTIPAPYLPSVMQPVGRNYVSLHWNSPFRPGNNKDTTKFGFNVTLCMVEPGSTCYVYTLLRGQVTAVTTTSSGLDGVNSVVYSQIPDIRLVERVDKSLSASVGYEVYSYSTKITQLPHNSKYKYRYRQPDRQYPVYLI